MMIDTIGIIARGNYGRGGRRTGAGSREPGAGGGRWCPGRGTGGRGRGGGVKSKVKGSCGRRRVVAVKAVTRRVRAAAAVP